MNNHDTRQKYDESYKRGLKKRTSRYGWGFISVTVHNVPPCGFKKELVTTTIVYSLFSKHNIIINFLKSMLL
jgi:hypothetical protein